VNSKSNDALHDAVRGLLSREGNLYTSNLRGMVDVLVVDGPLTLPELLDRREELAQSSAYRGLGVLIDAGAVRRIIHDSDHARYELDERLTGHHHHHLVCTTCGVVIDVELPMELERALDESLDTIAQSEGFVLDGHDLDIRGRCLHCEHKAAGGVEAAQL
jgi:Fur family ferric uptake transcriptional regulator